MPSTEPSMGRRLGGESGGPGYLNAAAFTAIPIVGATPGVAGTGGTGWGQFRYRRHFGVGPVQLRCNVALGNFGQITSTSVNPRMMQLALKYLFQSGT